MHLKQGFELLSANVLTKDNFKQGHNMRRFSELQKLDFIRAVASLDTGIKSLKLEILLYLLESES